MSKRFRSYKVNTTTINLDIFQYPVPYDYIIAVKHKINIDNKNVKYTIFDKSLRVPDQKAKSAIVEYRDKVDAVGKDEVIQDAIKDVIINHTANYITIIAEVP